MSKRQDVESKWCNNCSKKTVFSEGLCLNCLKRIGARFKGQSIDDFFIQQIRLSHPEVNDEDSKEVAD